MSGYRTKLIKVYLLDDHDILRRGLRDLLTAARDIQVVGESRDAQGAVQAILDLQADVMVLDLQLQDGTGIEVCREVRSRRPTVTGLLLTSFDDDDALVAAILAGAGTYIVKSIRNADLIGTIRKLGAGRSLLDPAAVERAGEQVWSRSTELDPPLTDRERQVLTHVLAGLTNQQIADHTGMDVEPVAAQIATIIDRLTVVNPTRPGRPGLPGRHRRS